MSIVSQVEILPGYKTDHSLLLLELHIDDFKKGKGFWRFNNSLLKDYDYVLQIKSIISETQNEYKVNMNMKVHFLSMIVYFLKYYL